ncbi:MAG: type IV secretion system protein [Gammaproteobacteria bacterium]|nr:type IV secretion system protein [Gammaproteobacteria bacterium]
MKNNFLIKFVKKIIGNVRAIVKTWPLFIKDKRKKQHNQNMEKSSFLKKSALNNPYLQSKALWNDVYGSVEIKLQNAYRIILILAVVIGIAIIGFVVVAGESKVQPVPFIVHGDEVITLTASQSTSVNRIKNQLAVFFAKQFIRASRTVSADGESNAAHEIAAVSMVKGEALKVLKQYYKINDPNTIGNRSVVDIGITSVISPAPHHLTIRWRQTYRDSQSGQVLQIKSFLGDLTYGFDRPSQNATILNHNPVGFVVRYLSWSSDEVH